MLYRRRNRLPRAARCGLLCAPEPGGNRQDVVLADLELPAFRVREEDLSSSKWYFFPRSPRILAALTCKCSTVSMVSTPTVRALSSGKRPSRRCHNRRAQAFRDAALQREAAVLAPIFLTGGLVRPGTQYVHVQTPRVSNCRPSFDSMLSAHRFMTTMPSDLRTAPHPARARIA